MTDFRPFRTAYPPDDRLCQTFDGERLARRIAAEFGVPVPTELTSFWSEVGAGYFGERELYFFDDGENDMPRPSILEWNRKAFWAERWPRYKPGQIVFFAETCLGEQIGYGITDDGFAVELCCFDTAENYRITDSFQTLFQETLTAPHVFVDADILSAVRESLGPLPDGMHYAPIISPLLGGSVHPRNFQFEPPDVHLITAIASKGRWE